MKKNFDYLRTLLALVAILTLGTSALANNTSLMPVHDSPPDVEFLDMMMMHHQQGIEMARMAEQKAQLPRLKEFARRTITDQEQDIQKMQQLRDRLFANTAKADKMRMGGKAMTTAEMQRMAQMDMQKLEAATGTEFDRTFLATFMKHHEMALSMSRYEMAHGEQHEVKDIARETIAKQTKDLGEMREMMRQVGGAPGRARGRSMRGRA